MMDPNTLAALLSHAAQSGSSVTMIHPPAGGMGGLMGGHPAVAAAPQPHPVHALFGGGGGPAMGHPEPDADEMGGPSDGDPDDKAAPPAKKAPAKKEPPKGEKGKAPPAKKAPAKKSPPFRGERD